MWHDEPEGCSRTCHGSFFRTTGGTVGYTLRGWLTHAA
jgi:hypothetical protein